MKRFKGHSASTTMSTMTPSTSIMELDGSQGEGGGQILRNAMTYAAIFQKPLKIHSIRAKRSKPGLAAQHLTAIGLAATMGGGCLTQGAHLKSTQVVYQPNTVPTDGGDNDNNQDNGDGIQVYRGIIDTAGSICLLLQAGLPCALFCPNLPKQKKIRLELQGGTNASMAPQYDYWYHIFLPTLLEQFFSSASAKSTVISDKDPTKNLLDNDNDWIQANVLERGYFPKGGGQVHVTMDPTQFPSRGDKTTTTTTTPTYLPLQPVNLTERGHVTNIYIRSFHAGKLPRHLAQQMAKAAQQQLEAYFNSLNSNEGCSTPTPAPTPTVEVDIVTEPNAVGNGLGILIVATTSTNCRLGGSALCMPKQKARDVGQQAAQQVIDALQVGGCVDEWLQDQLILYMALAEGTSRMVTCHLTLHTQTAIQVAQQLVPGVQFHVAYITEEDDGDGNHDTITATEDHNQAPTTPTYGKDGLILGKHMITCHGIGYKG